MKILIAVSLLLTLFTDPKSFYDLSVKTIEGNIVNLNDYRSKKVVIIILSTNSSDTANLQILDSLSRQYMDSFTIIGVPSLEQDSTTSNITLQNYYRTYLGSQFIISESLYTTKASGQQSDLFEWLTNKDENLHFDMQPEGPGTKYYIDGNGELAAVLSPGISLTNKVINKIILNN